MNELLIWGCGSHSRVVTEIVKKIGFRNIIYLNENLKSKNFLGHEVIRKIPENWDRDFFIAIGNNFVREQKYQEFMKKNPKSNFVTIKDPTSHISKSAILGAGSLVMPLANINSNVKIGRGSLVNISAVIDHDSVLSDFSSLAPGAIVGGNVSFGKRSALLIGSSIVSNLKIGDDVVIGAGSTVFNDVKSNSLCIGMPSKIIKTRYAYESYMS